MADFGVVMKISSRFCGHFSPCKKCFRVSPDMTFGVFTRSCHEMNSEFSKRNFSDCGVICGYPTVLGPGGCPPGAIPYQQTLTHAAPDNGRPGPVAGIDNSSEKHWEYVHCEYYLPFYIFLIYRFCACLCKGIFNGK